MRVPPEARALYHAALAHGANHLATLVRDAVDTLEHAGVVPAERLLGPLLEAALDNTLRHGEYEILPGLGHIDGWARSDLALPHARRFLVAGPVVDGADDLVGITILEAGSAEEALGLANEDPGARAGRARS